MGTAKYTKTTWVNGSTAVGATNMNNIESGIEKANGIQSLNSLTTGSNNIALGDYSLQTCTFGGYNVAIGTESLKSLTTSSDNIAIGYQSIYTATTASINIAIGNNSLYLATTASNNISIGQNSSLNLTYGTNNVAIGLSAYSSATTSNQNVYVGHESGSGTWDSDNTAIGYRSAFNMSAKTNCSYLGANTTVTGNNQVQLGDSATTTYVYGTVQNRSDLRDKTDVRETTLGLNFINELRPVDYKWDMRVDYMVLVEDQDGNVVRQEMSKDGSKKRNRFHHGLIAQEVQQICEQNGYDFGGWQDHKIAGGDDIYSIGYDELIAPLIKAVQELSQKIDQLEARLGGD